MDQDINTAEPYVLFSDNRRSLRDLNKRMLFLMVPAILLSFVGAGLVQRNSVRVLPPLPTGSPPAQAAARRFHSTVNLIGWIPWFLVAECLVLYVGMARSHKKQKQKQPIVTLDTKGIAVDTMATHLGLIYWEEIADVRAYTLIYRHVGIVPKDARALRRRLGWGRGWLLALNAACMPLYRPFGIFVAAINIPELYLPITADELLRRIQAYQAAYAPPVFSEEGVWPPPPAK